MILGETSTAPDGYVYSGSVLIASSPDGWTTKASVPTARSEGTAAVANNKIYLIGGDNGSYLPNNEEYDPVTNTWTTEATRVSRRSFLCSQKELTEQLFGY